MNYKNTADFALELDAKDELKNYRNEFHIPLQKNLEIEGDLRIQTCLHQ
jgi:hypothetical protein